MGLTTTEQALLIILSAALAVFLILGIILLVYLIRAAKKVNIIVDKAQVLTEKAEHVSEFFEKTAPAMAITRLLGNIAEAVMRNSKRNHNDKRGGDDG